MFQVWNNHNYVYSRRFVGISDEIFKWDILKTHREPHRKTASQENSLTGRRPHGKNSLRGRRLTTSYEGDLAWLWPHNMINFQEDKVAQTTLINIKPLLSTAQPQFVFNFPKKSTNILYFNIKMVYFVVYLLISDIKMKDVLI